MRRRPYKKFVWVRYNERYRPGIDDVLDEIEDFESEDELRDLEFEEDELREYGIDVDLYSSVSAPFEIDSFELETEACVTHFECPPGYVCRDGKCVSGIQLDLIEDEQKCKSDPDCPLGQVCVFGYCSFSGRMGVEQTFTGEPCASSLDCSPGSICISVKLLPPGKAWTEVQGVCVDYVESPIIIRGVIDKNTCDFCKTQIGRIGYLMPSFLPPYHKHCRCWWEYATYTDLLHYQ